MRSNVAIHLDRPSTRRLGSSRAWAVLAVALLVLAACSASGSKKTQNGVRSTTTPPTAASKPDSWSPIPAVPIQGVANQAVWTGTELVAIHLSTDADRITAASFDPAKNAWRALPDTILPKVAHLTVGPRGLGQAEVLDPHEREKVEVTGIGVGNGSPGTDLSIYVEPLAVWTGSEVLVWTRYGGAALDLAASRWRPLPRSPLAADARHQAVWSGRELLVWSGNTVGTKPSDATTDTAAYDPKSDRWQSGPASPLAPTGNIGYALWSGREMLIWESLGKTRHGAAYDPEKHAWRSLASIPADLIPDQGTPKGKDQVTKVVLAGSQVIAWSSFGTSTYDIASDRWNQSVAATVDLLQHDGATGVWSGKELILWGGGTELAGGEGIGSPVTDGLAFDLQQAKWRRLPTVPLQGRFGHFAIWTGTDMLILGGEDLKNSFNDGGRYRPA